MIYGSVCSGIEAATVAWHPLGWRPAFLSEIEKFPRAVLAHHYPEIPLHGDFTTIKAGEYERIDLLVGGTPCQSFSVAGLRGGMDDDRGNLALEFLRLADRLRPRWIVWENVPGVLSSAGGRDFGSILGGMGQLGYGWAYRVLDAQFFGVAQRRRRVFVVGYLGDWRRAAAVLFERHGLSGHPAPRRETGQRITGPIAGCSNGGGANGPGRTADDADSLISAEFTEIAFHIRQDPISGDVAQPVEAKGPGGVLSFALRGREGGAMPEVSDGGVSALRAASGGSTRDYVAYGLRSDLSRSGEAKRPSVDGAGKARLRDAGFNPLEEQSPTLDAARPHTVAVFDPNQITSKANRSTPTPELAHTLPGTSNAPVAFNITPSNSNKDYNARQSERAQAITGGGNRPSARGGDLITTGITIHGTDKTANAASMTDLAGSIRTKAPGSVENSSTTAALHGSAVRRLTPRECERLQGFPDDYTAIPYRGKVAADGPRYKALGNSMAVPCMAWLGRRIQMVEDICPPSP